MIKGCIAVSLGLLLLTGCRSHPEIPVSDAQSLVMESTVLAAGVTAEPPELTASDIQPSASSRVYNERQEPITVHYRFYWYDCLLYTSDAADDGQCRSRWSPYH